LCDRACVRVCVDASNSVVLLAEYLGEMMAHPNLLILNPETQFCGLRVG
jgi:hypothetical protein